MSCKKRGTEINHKSLISVFSFQAPSRRLGMAVIRDLLQVLKWNEHSLATWWTEVPSALQVHDVDAHQLASTC